jgi:hypothetical protein
MSLALSFLVCFLIPRADVAFALWRHRCRPVDIAWLNEAVVGNNGEVPGFVRVESCRTNPPIAAEADISRCLIRRPGAVMQRSGHGLPLFEERSRHLCCSMTYAAFKVLSPTYAKRPRDVRSPAVRRLQVWSFTSQARQEGKSQPTCTTGRERASRTDGGAIWEAWADRGQASA